MLKIILIFLIIFVSDHAWAEDVEKITPRKAQIIILVNEDIEFILPDGKKFSAKNVLIKDVYEEKIIGYYYKSSLIDFSALESIEIIINNGQYNTKINWPYIEINNLYRYLSQSTSTDCTGFASFIKGAPVIKWSGEPDLLFMRPSDVIRMSKDKKCRDLVHHAVYLGEDLYISDYGSRNDFIVSTFSQMKEVYNSNYDCLLSPEMKMP